MRVFRTMFVALAATATSINAKALQQHHQRSLVDVCANVDADLKLLGIVVGHLDLCLCVSAIAGLLTSNPIIELAVVLFGDVAVTGALTALINAAADVETCNYPYHAVPFCAKGNPCDFTCSDGFTAYPTDHPTECKCESPHTVCNGVCGDFPHCSSQVAKRDASWRDATCPHGWSACGIWGGGRLDYECVDVRKDLWSCGGCGIPLMSTDPTGVDCTAIPGVHDVSCVSSRCVVQRCKEGFIVSADRTECAPTTRMNPNTPTFSHNGGVPYKE